LSVPRRSSPQDVQSLDDLSRLGDLVVDKRLGARANAKRNRRNRHYERQFLRAAVLKPLPNADEDDDPKP
jgi:hypothetical protein